MIDNRFGNSFIESAKHWICDGYHASIRFIASVDKGEFLIIDSSILLSPLPPVFDNSFYIQGGNIYIGQIELMYASQDELIQYIENAQNGIIETPNGTLNLSRAQNYTYYTEGAQRYLWSYQLHLQIGGSQTQLPTHDEFSSIDNILRLSTPPFDGLSDAANWLGLHSPGYENRSPAINVRIDPPVDLIFDECALKDDSLKVVLHAHPEFDVKLLSLAIRGVPGNALNSRVQIANEIAWQDIQDNRRIGTAIITTENSDNILAMLLIGGTVVRRQWFLDPDKSRNNRLIAVQSFDRNLRMVRSAVLETTDAHKFEKGICALLFLLGFSPCLQVETDSPDIIVQTPSGRIILVECTLRIRDFPSKLGKLVDRRGALNKELEQNGHPSQIAIALVCRLPRDQIAAHESYLADHNALLVSEETLSDAFVRVRGHNDPDKMLQEAEATLLPKSQISLGI